MADETGAAPAAAESTPAPETVQTPNPVATEAQGHPEPDKQPEPKAEAKPEPEVKKPISTREALEKAAAKVEKDNAPAKAEADKPADKTPPVKSEQTRDETGKFAAKEGDKPIEVKTEPKPDTKTEAKPSHTAGNPPARFTDDVKQIWATLPDNVRGEVSRMERELTQGFEKYRVAAERDAELNEFHELARQTGTDLKTALGNYIGIERQLRADPIKGLEQVCQNIGVSLRDVAAYVMGQTPDQTASAQDATIRELNQKIARLEQQVGSVSQTFQQQQEATALQEVNRFAAEHPRFEELANDIAFFMKSGRAKDLSEAYDLAERLNPAPVQASTEQPAASSAPAIDLSAQTDKGQKSIAGAPSHGSDPAKRQPSNSIKESLRRAMATAG